MSQLNREEYLSTWTQTLSAAKAGEEWAWGLLYRNISGPVTGYLAARGAQDPEGTAAETFLQVARGISRFDGDEASFRSWVFVIAHRRLIDARRASDRRPKRSETDDLDNQATVGGNVEDDAVRNLEAEWVTGILEYLTDEQREVLSLRVVADLSLAETARVMDKTTGAVKALQRRALIAARNHIERGGVTQ